MPGLSDIRMEDPVLIQHAGKYGVKMRAISPSIHMIKADIETEIAPIVGSEEQANDLIAYIREGEESKEGIHHKYFRKIGRGTDGRRHPQQDPADG